MAILLGVSDSYAQRCCRQATEEGGDAAEGIERTSNGWRIHRDAVKRIGASRNQARVVVGYDLTFSPPKSVSVLWAGADDATRAEVLLALDEAVAAGLRYADRHTLVVRVAGEQQYANDVYAADYLHTTSRALEPQLHHHVVVANFGRAENGEGRALDARMLFLHAKTMGFIAAAELRHQLTARLGVAWGAIHNGIAEIEAVPEAARIAMSTRSREVYAEMGRLGLVDPASGAVLGTAAELQVAAWDTRAPKVHGVDTDELMAAWDERLRATGYDDAARAAVLRSVPGPGTVGQMERDEFFASLVRIAGITEHEAVFDRRRVVQEIATFAGERMSGDAIDALADDFLASPEIVRLQSSLDGSTRNVIRRRDGRVVSVPPGALYSTRAMLALEGRAVAAYRRGRDARAGVVPETVLRSVFARETFTHLSDEQQHFVRGLVSSGMTIQAGIGAAGTGKTTALEAAVTAWQEAGYTVLGAAVGGTQAIVLGEETGIDAHTVASVLTRYFGNPALATIDARTVLLVDEASLVSTQDFALLAQAVEERGACLRLIGDPAQHSSVAAGGMFRYLVERFSEESPALTRIYRQQGTEMAEVRLANEEYREGKIAEALERLDRDGRIKEAETSEEAFDLLACAWYAERQRRGETPDRRKTSMTAEHHFERVALNARARALLKADGTLAGQEIVVAGNAFQVGDEVIARLGDRDLRADGARRDQWVRNGSLGRVAVVREGEVVVDFERWGNVTVSRAYLETGLSGGVRGGLQHSYTLTTYAAQGATFAIAAPLITDASSRAGVYVGITRGQFDLQGVVIRRNVLAAPLTDDEMPVLRDETRALLATARSLEASGPERLAREIDPFAARVHVLVNTMRLPALDEALREGGPDAGLYEAALAERARVVGARAVLQPTEAILERLGPRPEPGPLRAPWDQAVGTIAVWREREGVAPRDDAPLLEWALGPRPLDREARADYDLIADLVNTAADTWARSRPLHPDTNVTPPTRSPSRDAAPVRRHGEVPDEELLAAHADLQYGMRRHGQSVRLLEKTIAVQQGAIEERQRRGRDAHSLLAQVGHAESRLAEHRAALEELREADADVIVELAERGIEKAASEPSMVPAARVEAVPEPEPPGGPEISGPTIEM